MIRTLTLITSAIFVTSCAMADAPNTAAPGATTAQPIVVSQNLEVKSDADVAATVARLEAALAAAGLTQFAKIDHAAGAASVGQALRPTVVVIFGNPNIGTALMTSEQTAGLDLPLKALVYEDASGDVYVAYPNPEALARRYNISDRAEVLARMKKGLATVAGKAAGAE